jgi:hypothetical protein
LKDMQYEALYNAAIDLMKQSAFITALLSGFSITFLIGLLQIEKKQNEKTIRYCLLLISFSACCLIVSTITSMSGAYWLTERPALADIRIPNANPEVLSAVSWSVISFLMG